MSETEPDPDAPDYYGLIGLDPSASADAVETALKRAKGAYHPDQSSLDTATANRCFDRVREAERVLGDPEERDAYDTFLDRFDAETGHETYEAWCEAGKPGSPGSFDPDESQATGASEAADTETASGASAAGSEASATTGTGSGTSAETATSGTRTRRSTAGQTPGQASGGTRTRTQTTGDQSRTTRTQGRRSAEQRRGGRGRRARTERSSAAETGSSSPEPDAYPDWVLWVDGWVSLLASPFKRRLSVLAPVGRVLDRGLDVVATPGVAVQQRLAARYQLVAVVALTLAAGAVVGSSSTALDAVVSLLWVVGTVLLSAGGVALWALAVGVTYVRAGGAPLYASVVLFVVTAVYAVLVVAKAD